LFRSYNLNKKAFNQEVELIHDLEPIEVAEAEVEKFEYEHGDKCGVWALVKPVNGLSSSRKVPASSSLRLSNLVVLLRFRSPLGGMLVGMGFLQISSLKRVMRPFGLSFALLRS
jgi:hypothetical protein